MKKCMYCNNTIEDDDFVTVGKKFAHSSCYTSYLSNVEELTEFIAIDSDDFYGVTMDYPSAKYYTLIK